MFGRFRVPNKDSIETVLNTEAATRTPPEREGPNMNMNWLLEALRNEIRGTGFWAGLAFGLLLSAAIALRFVEIVLSPK